MSLHSNLQGHGDLGRRITEQRERAGLSRLETAQRSGLADSYLRYLETSPEPRPSPGDLDRLATALSTTPAVLLGVGLAVPPGQSRPADGPRPEAMDAEECRACLAGGGIGRFVYASERGPVAVPVNYRMRGADIIFRTAARAGLAAASWQPQVSFEVDNLDDTLAEGWSVLVSGQAMIVTTAAELAEVSQLGVTPWAGGDRDCYIKLVPSEITGRSIRRTAEDPEPGAL